MEETRTEMACKLWTQGQHWPSPSQEPLAAPHPSLMLCVAAGADLGEAGTYGSTFPRSPSGVSQWELMQHEQRSPSLLPGGALPSGCRDPRPSVCILLAQGGFAHRQHLVCSKAPEMWAVEVFFPQFSSWNDSHKGR